MDWLSEIGAVTGAIDKAISAALKLKELLKPKPGVDQPVIKQDDIRPMLEPVFEHLFVAKQRNLALLDQQQALKNRIADLEKEIGELNNFAGEVMKYEVREVAPHSFVYAYKEPETEIQRRQYFCPACFDRKKRSMLQFQKRDFHFDTLQCKECRAEILIENNQQLLAETMPRQTRAFDDY